MQRAKINYSEEELSFISDRRLMTRRDLWELFQQKYNRQEISYDNLCALCKRKGWLTGRTGQYEKGCTPHPNAGTKGPNKTSFKKGRQTHNTLPVGSERIDNKDGYILIKIAEGKNQYRMKHRVVYEQNFGKLKPTDVIRFKDGNRLNVHPSNLEKISRTEHFWLNKLDLDNQPEEIKPTVRAIAKLNTKLHAVING